MTLPWHVGRKRVKKTTVRGCGDAFAGSEVIPRFAFGEIFPERVSDRVLLCACALASVEGNERTRNKCECVWAEGVSCDALDARVLALTVPKPSEIVQKGRAKSSYFPAIMSQEPMSQILSTRESTNFCRGYEAIQDHRQSKDPFCSSVVAAFLFPGLGKGGKRSVFLE